jgi:short-subunit dehydrogenase
VMTFTEGLSFDLKGTGVRAVAVCPGYVHTEFHDRAGVRVVAPEFMWIPAEKVVNESLAALFRGTGSPVVIPSPQYKALMTGARLAPRNLVLRIARQQRMKRSHT